MLQSKGMLLASCLLLAVTTRSVAQDTAMLLSPDLKEVSIDTFFSYVKRITGFKPIYGSILVKDLAPITYQRKNVPLYKILDTTLGRLGLGYTFFKEFILLRKDSLRINLYNTIDTLRGRVTDDKGDPLNGVSVVNTQKKLYAITSHEGFFKLPWPSGSEYVEFTCVSFESKTIRVADPRAFQKIVLKPAPDPMGEVVVMPYHTIAQRRNTASVYRVWGTDLRNAGGNPMKALSGRVPGMVVTETSGAPGAAVRVQIRGRQSIGAIPGVDNQPLNDPLVLLNKIPLLTGNRHITLWPSAAGDPQAGGTAAGGISAQDAINPEDIETIDVLKDADATAIYGSRGAHGALLITTRQGAVGKPLFSGKIETGYTSSTWIPELLNNRQYVAMRKEALATAGLQPTANNAPDLLSLDTVNDYQDIPQLLLGGTGSLIKAHVSMSGGDTLLRYFLSAGFYHEGSTLPAHLFRQRVSTYANIQYRSPNRRFQSVLSLHYSPLRYNSLVADPMFSTRLVPLLPRLRNDEGKLVWEKNGFKFLNPLGPLLNKHFTELSPFTGSLQLEYRLGKNLSWRTTLGYQQLPVQERSLMLAESRNPKEMPTGEMATANNQYKGWLIEPQLTYTRNWGKTGNTGLLLGTTFQEERQAWNTFQGLGYSNDALLGMPGAAAETRENSYAAVYRYHGVYGRANIDWRNRYFLNATGRLDASSRFGAKRPMAFFGALGAAWIFSQEKWIMKHLHWLTYGKLRASYGTTGNDQIGDYGYLETWAPQINLLRYDGTVALNPNRQANPWLGWEKNQKKEVALELGWEEYIFFNIAWYHNTTSSQVISVEIPHQSGPPGSIMINSPATVLNTGWEFTGRFKWQWNKKNGWNSTFLLTLPRNRLQSFPGIERSAYKTSLVVGEPLSVQRGHAFLGVDPNTGLFTIPSGTTDTFITGHWEPRCYASWSNEWKLNRWRLSIFLEARQQQAVNPWLYAYTGTLPGKWTGTQLTNQPVAILQRWQQPGDQAPLQRVTASSQTNVTQAAAYYRGSEAAITGASFLRIRAVRLACDLPANWQRRLKLAEASIYVQGQNLWTYTNYRNGDPTLQSPLKLPSLRTIVAGLQVSF